MSAHDDLLQAALESNWGIQLQLAWTHAFLKNFDYHNGLAAAIKFRFTFTPQQAFDELRLLLPLIDQTYPPGSFSLFLRGVVAADAALAER